MGARWTMGCQATFLFFTFLPGFVPAFRFKHDSPGGNGLSPLGSICRSCLPCPQINSSNVAETRVASLIDSVVVLKVRLEVLWTQMSPLL